MKMKKEVMNIEKEVNGPSYVPKGITIWFIGLIKERIKERYCEKVKNPLQSIQSLKFTTKC